MITSIAKGITDGGDHTDLDPADMTRRHPEIWPTAADAAADIELTGWKFRLARPRDRAAGNAPIHLTLIGDDGARRHVWWFEQLGVFADQNYEPVDPLPPGTIAHNVGLAGSVTLG